MKKKLVHSYRWEIGQRVTQLTGSKMTLGDNDINRGVDQV